jgi:hypothetical protein
VLEIDADGTFQMTMTFMGSAPQVETGTWSLEGGDLLILGAAGEIETEEFDVSLEGTTLTVRSTDLVYDFDEDGTEEPALFEAIFERR